MKTASGAMTAAILVLSFSSPAPADDTFTLNAVMLQEGTLTGYFTTNNAITTVTGFDITASAAGNFPGVEYTMSDAYLALDAVPSYFQIDTNGNNDQLFIEFNGASLTMSGGTLSTNSFEYEPTGGDRSLVSGSVVGVPEPASIVLTSTALAAIVAGASLRRKRAISLRSLAKA